MAEIRSAWGIIKARTMRGVDDRSDFYRFWYRAWELEPRENPVKGWWAIPIPKSRLAAGFQSGGNLVLTNKRLLWEPMATKVRSAFGPHGRKMIVNLIARAQDAAAPAMPLEWRLDHLDLKTSEDRKVAVWPIAEGSPPVGFFFGRSILYRGSEDERADFVTQVRAEQQRNRKLGAT
jgi:hypothetical protein